MSFGESWSRFRFDVPRRGRPVEVLGSYTQNSRCSFWSVRGSQRRLPNSVRAVGFKDTVRTDHNDRVILIVNQVLDLTYTYSADLTVPRELGKPVDLTVSF